MNDILYFFYMTMELWAFLGILGLALFVEAGVLAYQRKKDRDLIRSRVIDNPALW